MRRLRSITHKENNLPPEDTNLHQELYLTINTIVRVTDSTFKSQLRPIKATLR